MSVVKLEVCARQQSLTCPCAGQALLYAMARAASTAPPAASGDGLPGKGFGRRRGQLFLRIPAMRPAVAALNLIVHPHCGALPAMLCRVRSH